MEQAVKVCLENKAWSDNRGDIGVGTWALAGAFESLAEQEAMDKSKMVISAQEVLRDIRSGMDDETFMAKYRLSFRQLQRLFRKMILGGFIAPQELAQRLCVTKSQVMEAMNQVNKAIKELDE